MEIQLTKEETKEHLKELKKIAEEQIKQSIKVRMINEALLEIAERELKKAK